jgi:hypothetical protein
MSKNRPPTTEREGESEYKNFAWKWWGWINRNLSGRCLGQAPLKKEQCYCLENSCLKRRSSTDFTSRAVGKEGNGDAPLGNAGRRALRREQCNVDGQSIAGQQLSKHTVMHATMNSLQSAPRLLLCNDSANIFQQQIKFSVQSARRLYNMTQVIFGAVLS